MDAFQITVDTLKDIPLQYSTGSYATAYEDLINDCNLCLAEKDTESIPTLTQQIKELKQHIISESKELEGYKSQLTTFQNAASIYVISGDNKTNYNLLLSELESAIAKSNTSTCKTLSNQLTELISKLKTISEQQADETNKLIKDYKNEVKKQQKQLDKKEAEVANAKSSAKQYKTQLKKKQQQLQKKDEQLKKKEQQLQKKKNELKKKEQETTKKNTSQTNIYISSKTVKKVVSKKVRPEIIYVVPPEDSDFICPDSSSRYLTDADLCYLTKSELRIARNEIYARYGRRFSSKDLQNYFNKKCWYYGYIEPKNFDDDWLTKIENANVALIKKYEAGYKPVPSSNNSDFICPDSNQRYLTDADLRYLSKSELRIARNEIYARYGRRFSSKDLQSYFNKKSWYYGYIAPNNFNDDWLTKIENANVSLIKKYEAKYK